MSIATRILVVGSVAGAGMFTALAAWAQPARAKISRVAARTRVAPAGRSGFSGVGDRPAPTTTAPVQSDDDGGGESQLAPPVTNPAPAYNQNPAPTYNQNPPPNYAYSSPPVVSGAS